MSKARTTDPDLRDAADILEAIAEFEGWSSELFDRFEALTVKSEADDLLSEAREELIDYSGEFSSYNIFFQKTKPDAGRVSEYKRIFRSIADALRNGKTFEEWDAVENAGAYKPGDFTRWLKRCFSKQRKT
jgi:hypothetical protein